MKSMMKKALIITTLSFLMSILLLVISFPVIDSHFCCIAKQSEAKYDLRCIYEAQKNYHKLHNKYADSLSDLKIGCFPEKLYYIIFFNKEKRTDVLPKRDLPPYYRTYANDDKWNAFALQNIDSDEEIDVWMINEKGEIFHFEDDCKN